MILLQAEGFIPAITSACDEYTDRTDSYLGLVLFLVLSVLAIVATILAVKSNDQ